MTMITPGLVQQVQDKIAPFLAELPVRHRERFRQLMELVSNSEDGYFTRAALEQALYPDAKPDSLRAALSDFRKRIKEVGNKAGISNLSIIPPRGKTLHLQTDTRLALPISSGECI